MLPLIMSALGMLQNQQAQQQQKKQAKVDATLGQVHGAAPKQGGSNALLGLAGGLLGGQGGGAGGLLGGLLGQAGGSALDPKSRRQSDGSMADPLSYDSIKDLEGIGIY